MDLNEQAVPLSIEQIEALVATLYQPNKPEVIAATQATLTQLQSSPRAWSIARDLLTRPDEKVKFHGALIIIIKLNTESSSLSNEDATELLLNLIGWYIDSFSRENSPLVTRKLSSALATFLIHFHSLWGRYICHLATCLAARQPCHPGVVGKSDETFSAFGSLESTELQAILWVITTVMEDASKLDLDSETNSGLYDVLRRNTADAIGVLSKAMVSNTVKPQVHEDAIKCLQSWIWFAHRTSARDRYFIDALRPLVTVVISALSTDTSTDTSMELVTDVLTNFPSLLTEEHYSMLLDILRSPWAQDLYQKLVRDDFEFETFQFAQLLLGFGEARVDGLIRSDDERSRSLLLSLCGLLSVPGYPGVEDKVFIPTLEFWSTYVETLADEMHPADMSPGSWAAPAVSFAMQAVSNAWQRICYPPPDEFSQWDTSDRVGFNDARKDVADLLQSTFALAGPQLAFTFAELLLEALSTTSWFRLEAAAFCLGSLSDCIREDTRCDDALFSVFSSSLFTILQANRSEVPARVRQTCVSLIENYTEYFERNVALLPPALNLLFSMVGEQGLAAPACKSISRLCSSCRHHLFPEIWAFLDEYQKLMTGHKLDCLSNEKILGGISCVAQGSPDESQRFAALSRILAFVEADLRKSMEWGQYPPPATDFPCGPGSRCLDDGSLENPSLHMAIRVLRCLLSIARGFQSPAEAPIELEVKSRRGTQPGTELSRLQRRVFDIIIQIETLYPTVTEVTETICSILRAGFSEYEPGPFVFPPKDIARYLTGHGIDVPRIGLVVSTACSFVSSVEHHEELPSRQALLSEILLWVVGLTRNLPEPESDPELTHNAIDFCSRLVAKSPQTLLRLQPFDAAEFLFLFTLKVLDGREPLPKAASAEFWAVFMNLRTASPDTQEGCLHVMNTLGPLLGQSLARNIGGNASRSELDKLSEPIKRLVSHYPSAKDWLGAGLEDPSFPSSKVTSEEKALFVKKLISLRGSRATNRVVRDFWLTARGSNFAYAS